MLELERSMSGLGALASLPRIKSVSPVKRSQSMTRANGFFVNSPTTSGKKRKQKSLKLRRKEAMKKLLRRHNKSYAIDTYDKRRQQKKQIMGMPLPAWPLVPEEMLLSSKREEEHKASLFKTRALQERELLSQQFRASSTRVGLIPIVARTSLAPIEKQVSIVNDYNYYNPLALNLPTEFYLLFVDRKTIFGTIHHINTPSAARTRGGPV